MGTVEKAEPGAAPCGHWALRGGSERLDTASKGRVCLGRPVQGSGDATDDGAQISGRSFSAARPPLGFQMRLS